MKPSCISILLLLQAMQGSPVPETNGKPHLIGHEIWMTFQ